MTDDPFKHNAESPSSPASHCFEITPDDLVNLATMTKAIYVGTGGDINIQPASSEVSIILRNVADGAILPVRVTAVRSSGTTALDIVGLA